MSIFNLFGIADAVAEATQVAQTTGAAQPEAGAGASFLHMLPMLILFILVFYFLLVRPQTKRAKEHKALMSNIAVGDEIMTSGGMVGKVSKMKDNYITLRVSKDVEIMLQKGAIASVLPKGTMDSVES